MAKKEMLIFTRDLTATMDYLNQTQACIVNESFLVTQEINDCNYTKVNAFVTADGRVIELDELVWLEVFQTLDEYRNLFVSLINSYWKLAVRNKFSCVLVTIII